MAAASGKSKETRCIWQKGSLHSLRLGNHVTLTCLARSPCTLRICLANVRAAAGAVGEIRNPCRWTENARVVKRDGLYPCNLHFQALEVASYILSAESRSCVARSVGDVRSVRFCMMAVFVEDTRLSLHDYSRVTVDNAADDHRQRRSRDRSHGLALCCAVDGGLFCFQPEWHGRLNYDRPRVDGAIVPSVLLQTACIQRPFQSLFNRENPLQSQALLGFV